jgi:hypothetical protein
LPPISARFAVWSGITSRKKWERGSIMKEVSGSRANQPAKRADQHIALHLCYGQIGISAVAAAARYQGGTKNPAYAPVAAGSYEDEASVV